MLHSGDINIPRKPYFLVIPNARMNSNSVMKKRGLSGETDAFLQSNGVQILARVRFFHHAEKVVPFRRIPNSALDEKMPVRAYCNSTISCLCWRCRERFFTDMAICHDFVYCGLSSSRCKCRLRRKPVIFGRARRLGTMVERINSGRGHIRRPTRCLCLHLRRRT